LRAPPLLSSLALLTTLTACTGDASVDPEDTAVVDAEVTWFRDVKPIVDTACVRCHQDGGVGPFDFTLPEVFSAFAERAVARIDEGTMPPGASDPECREYFGMEHLTLDAAAADVVQRWIDLGKVLGDPADAVDIEPPADALAEVDLSVQLARPYTPAFASQKDPGNEYRCFYLDHGQSEDFWIRGLHPIVDNAELVHHIVLATVPASNVPDHDRALGVDCIDGGSMTDGMIAAWAPGMLPVELPDGAAMKIGKDHRIVMQVHYYDSGGGEASDASGYAFDLVPESTVTEEVFMLPLGAFNFTIPAGAERHTQHAEYTVPAWIPVKGKLYATFPHMHVLGTGYKVWVERAGAQTCLAESDHYAFENQMTYQFKEPLVIQGGDVFHVECTWNNSTSNPELIHDPPVPIGYGERTDEEMCFAFTLLSVGTR
jgi:hypothetical protein